MATRAPRRSHAIVLGIDFLTGSQLAQQRAAELARRHRAALHLVHATSRLPLALTRRFPSLGDDKLRAALLTLVAQLRDTGVDAHGHLMHGEPVRCLTAKARAVAADLVVVGTRGGSVLAAMLGSTPERLASMDQHRVLLVRRTAARAYRKVVIAADEDSRLGEQLAAAEFVSAKAAVVLHAYRAPFESTLISYGASGRELARYRTSARREAELRMSKLMLKTGIDSSQLVLHHGSPVEVLERFDPESLMVLSRGRARARQLLLGSVTRAVVAHCHADVLLV
jgi:nucleotide-binding universal stress UspA family protein